jgi:hypothetical protein
VLGEHGWQTADAVVHHSGANCRDAHEWYQLEHKTNQLSDILSEFSVDGKENGAECRDRAESWEVEMRGRDRAESWEVELRAARARDEVR